MKLKLDKEEQNLLESSENGEWVRVAEAKIRRHQNLMASILHRYVHGSLT